jgi:putative inorganic carbon (HCO3(-)) transporter
MLTLLRPIISWIFFNGLYFGGIGIALASIVRKAEWGLLLMVALIPQPNIFYRLYDFPMGKDFLDIIFCAVVIGIFVNKRGFERGGNSLLIIILVLVSYLAVWNSSRNFSLPIPISYANPMIRPWKGYAFMICMYLLTFNAVKDSGNQRKILVFVMALVVLFISIRSYRGFTAGASFIEESRSEGPFWVVGLGSNHFGAFIAYCSAVFLGLFFLDNNRWRKILFLGTVLLSLHPLFFAYSRGAYVGALIVLIFFGLAKKRSLLILVFVLLVSWQTLLPSSVVERIKMTKGESGDVESSVGIRLDLWDHALNLFEKHPVIGIGFGGFEYTMPEGVRWKDTHNYYVKMLSEQGIVGFGLLLITLFMAFRSGWKLLKIGKDGFEKGLGLGFMGCVLACASTNLFGDRWSYYEMGSYFWVFWGLVDRSILISNISVSACDEDRQE